jgi:hypothetical protein
VLDRDVHVANVTHDGAAYPGTVTSRPRTTTALATALATAALGLALLAGCSSDGAQTDCSLNACTVTFDRGADAGVNILGVEAKLIGTEDDRVTLEVAGEQVTLTTSQPSTEVGGLQVSLESANEDQIVVQISR